MQQDFANADGICRTCGEPIKEDLATCGDPMCNEEHAAYMRTMFKVAPLSLATSPKAPYRPLRHTKSC